jgi:Domain of unknown function (DUF1854)
MKLERDALGRLLLDGEPVTPVRAHPLSAPEEGISLMGSDGHERAWIEQLAELPEAERQLLQAELQARELHPQLQRLVSVSTFSTPSQWTVETDRGPLQFFLKSEEDIRRLGDGSRLLITSSHGLQIELPDRWQLDRASRRLLERFL